MSIYCSDIFLLQILLLIVIFNVKFILTSPNNLSNRMLPKNNGNIRKNKNELLKNDDVFSPPTSCEDDLLICENTPQYPTEHVETLLKKHAFLKKFSEEKPHQMEEEELVFKDDNINMEQFVCRSQKKIIYPTSGKTINGEDKFLLNIESKDKTFRQSVQIEICKTEGAPCDIKADVWAGYKMTCKQKFGYKKLLSLNKDGYYEYDSFKIPTACCCAHKKLWNKENNDFEFWKPIL